MAIDTTAYPIDLASVPLLEAEVERALAPYRALLTPELLEVFRDELILALIEDPAGAALLQRVRPVAMVSVSGPRAIAQGGEDSSSEPGTKGRHGGGR